MGFAGENKKIQFSRVETGVRDLDSICSLGAWDISGDQDWGVGRHTCPGLQLTYVARGKVDFLVDGQEHLLKPGDLAVTRPWQKLSVGNPNVRACQMYWLILDVGTHLSSPDKFCWPGWMIFSERDMEVMTEFLCTSRRSVWQAGVDVGDCFKKMHKDLYIRTDASRETHLRLHINELFVRFFDIQHLAEPDHQSDRATAQQAVDIFLSELHNHLDMDWTLDLMAERCGLKRSRFNEYCHQMTNRTPMEHLMDCRMQKAEQLLQNHPKMGISEIASSCGYHSSQYFATIFKREIGMRPTEFRALHLNK